jgi:DNA-binding SARP family transcriptional activator
VDQAPAIPIDGRRPRHSTASVEVALLGGFRVIAGTDEIALTASAQRLVAFLALHEHPISRPFVAGSLWPDATDSHATACLRSTLWRMGDALAVLVDAAGGRLRLIEDVKVDIGVLITLSSMVDQVSSADLDHLADGYAAELLPDFYDDWIDGWRERWRQIRLHALEDVARALASAGRYAMAIDVALGAVRAEPLRESAHRAVIEVHLAEGNLGEARRQYEALRLHLREELDVEPSPRTRALVFRE